MGSASTSIKKKHSLVEQLESRMLREIRRHDGISRLVLSKRMGISPSTSGIYVDRLIEDGYLVEEPTQDNSSRKRSRGRPEIYLRPSPKGGYFIGVEFEANVVHAVCLDFAENHVSAATVSLKSPVHADQLLDALEHAIDKVMPEDRSKLHGIGVGVPGLVDSAAGIARDYPHVKGWKNIPITQKLEDKFGSPVLLDNNARTAALAHQRPDHTFHYRSSVCLMIRSGIGAGLILRNNRWSGHHNIAGEIGRIGNFSFPDPSSNDEAIHNAEEVASISGILNYIREQIDHSPSSMLHPDRADLSIEHVIQAVNEGDSLAREAVLKCAQRIGWLCHLISLMIDPEAIIIAGPLAHLGDWILNEIRAEMGRYQAIPVNLRPKLLTSTLGEDAGAYGAASLVVDAWKPSRT